MIITSECVACGKCKALCPVDAIEIVNSRFKIIPEVCCECGICLEHCPIGAIAEK